MPLFLIIVSTLVVLTWGYLLLGRGQFWRVAENSGPSLELERKVRVVAVVPARNEADVIGEAVASLRAQRGVGLTTIVVDDHSDDGTAATARNADPAATVIASEPLPTGWSGKLWALQQGTALALQSDPDYLLFTDADIAHDPDNVARLVAIAESGAFDLASFMVKLHCGNFAERLLIPAFVFFFFKLYPPRWIDDPKRTTAGAAGGCVLIRPEALQRAGGIKRIRSEIIDDCSLAREVKRSGGRVWLGLTESARSIRPYGSAGEIGRMISRTAFNQLGHSYLILLVSIIGLTLTYIAPFALLLSNWWPASIAGALTFCAMMTAYIPMVRFYRLNPLWALTLPLAAIFYMGATIHSAMMFASGRGGAWKGRTQDLGASNAR